MFIREALEIEPKYDEEDANVHVRKCAQGVRVHRVFVSYWHIYGYEDKKDMMS